MPNDLLSQLTIFTGVIWSVVEILRKTPKIKDFFNQFSGEALSLGVSVFGILILIWSGQMPLDVTTVIKLLIASLGSQVFHDKVASPAGL